MAPAVGPIRRIIDASVADAALALRASKRPDLGRVLSGLLLAIAVSSNVVLYNITFAVALNPLPYESPDELVLLWNQTRGAPFERGVATPANVEQWRSRSRSFQQIETAELWPENPSAEIDLMAGGLPYRLHGGFVSGGFFDLLGVKALLGRTIGRHDSGRSVAVISHSLWQERFGADAIIGKLITLTAGQRRVARDFEVIGVLPPGVQVTYPEPVHIWLPQAERIPDTAALFTVVARLSSKVTIDDARSDMASIATALGNESSSNSVWSKMTVGVESMAQHAFGEYQPLVTLLWVIGVASALLVTLNVSLLAVGTSTYRRSEFATRLVLGATPWRVITMLTYEGCLVGVAGAAAGLLLAAALQAAIRGFVADHLSRTAHLQINAASVSIALLTVAVPVLVASLCSAAAVFGRDGAMARGTWAVTARMAVIVRRLIATQTASVVVVLSIGVGAVVSGERLERVDLGFDPEGLWVAKIVLLDERYRQKEIVSEFISSVRKNVQKIPGVEWVSVASSVPFGGATSIAPVSLSGKSHVVPASQRLVDRDHVRTLGLRVLAGRPFAEADAQGPAVALITKNLATALVGSVDVIGQRIVLAADDEVEVIGIVADVRDRRLDEPATPACYVLRASLRRGTQFVAVRSHADKPDWAGEFQNAIRAADPAQPVERVVQLEQMIAETIRERKFASVSVTAVALTAWLIAVTGCFGFSVWDVRTRRHDTATRFALGAPKWRLLAAPMLRCLKAVWIGVFAALPCTWLLAGVDISVSGLRLVASPAQGYLLSSIAVVSATALAVSVGVLRGQRAVLDDVLRRS